MAGGKINGKKVRTGKKQYNLYAGLHRYTIKPERINTEKKPHYDDDPATMAKYHRDVILALAKRYQGAELEEKLSELCWCSLETAKEVIKNAEK